MKKHVLIVALLATLVLLAGVVFLRTGHHTELPAGTAQRATERLSAPSQPLADNENASGLPPAGKSASAIEADPMPSMEDCAAALTKPKNSGHLMAAQKRLHIESFLAEQGDALEQELVADLAGYRPKSEGTEVAGLPAGLFWAYGPPSPDGERELTAVEQRTLTKRLNETGVEGLISPDASHLWHARWDDTTLVGHLVREHGEALYAAIATGRSFPVGLHELAIAIEEGVALADFIALIDTATVDLSETWWNGANLAKVAAIHGRPDILRHLMSNGVSPAVPRVWGRDGSVLDDIASIPEHPDKEVLAGVVEQLVNAGDHPYLPSTLATFDQWLPDVSMPPLHPDAAAALLAPSVADAAKTVVAMDAEWTARVEAATRLEQRCQEQLAVAEDPTEMFRGTDLATKQRYRETLEAHEERWLKEMIERARATNGDARGDAEEEDGALAEVRAQLGEAMAEDRWEDALAIADQLGQNSHLGLLYAALSSDAPLDVLLALVSRNGALPERTIADLARNRREDVVAVAEALEPFGLDVHHVDALGGNAFYVLAGENLEEEGNWRLAEYLADRHVSVKPSAFGLDPLDRVLTRLLDSPRWGRRERIRFARFLIDHGAPVESSHFELAEAISRANEETYRRLVSMVPEVAR